MITPAQLQGLSASVLNNQAIAFIQAGRVPEAMDLLQLGLARLRDRFLGSCEDPTTTSSTPSSWPTRREQRDRESNPVENGDDCSVQMTKIELSEEHSCKKPSVFVVGSIPVWMHHDVSFLTLYDRALLVETSDDNVDDEVLSAVILFNMALLHHSQGLECGKSTFLARASRLYRISLDILRKEGNEGSTLLLMAILNNLAHIQSHLFQMDDMRMSLDEMRTILSDHDESVEDRNLMQFEEHDYIIFFMNTMFGKGEEFTVAPAA